MTSKIRVTEVFYSIQGEGLYTGTPSVFLRLFGCNFRCKKFSLPKDTKIGKYNPEVEEIIKDGLDKYEKLEDLPLVNTGCDTYTSIYPEFKKFAKDYTIEELAEKIVSLIPGKKFTQNIHLILTGGEPLLGKQRQNNIKELINFLSINHGLESVTFETNGTQPIHVDGWGPLEIVYSVSAKLPCSGEKWEDAIKPEIVETYLNHYKDSLFSKLYLKFVVADEQDIEDAQRAIEEFGTGHVVYMMPIGGTDIGYNKNKDRVAQLCLEKGYRFSQRLHIDLFGNRWGT